MVQIDKKKYGTDKNTNKRKIISYTQSITYNLSKQLFYKIFELFSPEKKNPLSPAVKVGYTKAIMQLNSNR